MAKKEEDKSHNHIIAFDFETGGLDCQKCAVTEIGAVAFRADTFEQIWAYQSYILPNYTRKTKRNTLQSKKRVQQELFTEDGFLYEEKALTYSNITLELLEKKGKDIKVVAAEVFERFKAANLSGGRTTKPYLLGQNTQFDIGFLFQLGEVGGQDWEKVLAGKKDYFGNFQPDYEDTLRIAKNFFALDESVTTHKLGHIAELLGIELIEAHGALDDSYATMDVYKALMNKMRNGGDGPAGDSKKVKKREHFKF